MGEVDEVLNAYLRGEIAFDEAGEVSRRRHSRRRRSPGRR
jgi:hypothetical protein